MQKKILSVLLFFVWLSSSSDCASEGSWGYLNLDQNKQRAILPDNWYKLMPECKGNLQSPVNIEFPNTVYDQSMQNIVVSKKEGGSDIWNITNNGKTVQLNPHDAEFTFTMYPRNEVFTLLQIHFHWRGSEHFVDGKKFAGEIHLVFKSQTNPKQYSVIGFMMKLVDKDNLSFKSLIDQLQVVSGYNTASEFNFQLENVLPMNIHNFFRYSGSLTTPGCAEIVEWNVVDSPVLGFSEDQLLKFQSLLDSNGLPILTNARPIQNLNDRVVKRSFYPFYTRRFLDAASEYANDAQQVKSVKPIFCFVAFLICYLF